MRTGGIKRYPTPRTGPVEWAVQILYRGRAAQHDLTREGCMLRTHRLSLRLYEVCCMHCQFFEPEPRVGFSLLENDTIRGGLDHGPVNPRLATKCYVARGNIRNDKTSLKPSPGKDKIENRSNYENLLAVYLRRHIIYGCLFSNRWSERKDKTSSFYCSLYCSVWRPRTT